jgi:hypothetical protein
LDLEWKGLKREVIDCLDLEFKKVCLIFNINFEKAYDSINWNFFDYMMGRFDFDSKWRKWVKMSVFSGSLSMLVIGCPTKQINISIGLKQSDPIGFVLIFHYCGGVESSDGKVGVVGGWEMEVDVSLT